MPPVEGPTAVAEAPEEKKNVIGFIYPPPEVRNIVDKTASFVARNGLEFESRIRQNEQNNPKFNFLNPGDPYHAYYQHKVQECQAGKPPAPAKEPARSLVSAAQQQKQQELLRSVVQESSILSAKEPPKEAPPEYEFIADPPSISAFDLDVVRLTAQFVARNGRQFLTALMSTEQRNSQFDFLRPQHSLFQYFTKLLEQYTKVLIPPKDLIKRLGNEAEGSNAVYKQVTERVDWARHQAALKKKEEEAVEKERLEYASIDWHGFSVVETIDYQPWEVGTFPPPTNPGEVGKRVLAQDRMDEGLPPDTDMVLGSDDEDEGMGRGEQDDTQVQDMEEESSSSSSSESEGEDDSDRDDSSPPPAPDDRRAMPPPHSVPSHPLQPAPELAKANQIIVRNYDPHQEKAKEIRQSDQYLVSPITGERIAADKVDQHLKINMLDPRWLETKKKQEKESTNQDNVFAAGDRVRSSLKQLAERRTDIFGAGDEETIIGRKIGEEERKEPEKVTWDGHTASMDAATRAARANISINEQINQIHKMKGLLPDHEKEKIGPQPQTSGSGSSMNQPPPPPPQNQPPLPPPPKPQPPPPSNPPPPPPQSHVQPPPPPGPPGTTTAPHPRQPAPPGGNPPNMPQNQMMGQMGNPPNMPPPQQQMMRMPFGGPMPPMMHPNAGVMMVPRPPVMMTRPGFMPGPPGPPMGGFMPQQRPPMNMGAPGMPPPGGDEDDEGPAAKKARTEEALVQEGEWSQRYPGIVKFKVSVPDASDKAEWQLNGQTIHASFSLVENVSALKSFIQTETGVPPAKQKLVKDGMFFKDSLTLAYYNIAPACVVQMQLKERGGRKK